MRNRDLGTLRNQRLQAEISKLKVELRHGSSVASNNIAATYRQLGNFRRAFQWWKRTARSSSGEAWLEVGYCLQHGIGTRRDLPSAIRAFRNALSRSWTMTPFSEEETQYHLAIALLERSRGRTREAERLLKRAAAEGDYPQASSLLAQLRERGPLSICCCRRELPRRLGGKSHCKLHRRHPLRRTV